MTELTGVKRCDGSTKFRMSVWVRVLACLILAAARASAARMFAFAFLNFRDCLCA